MTKGIRRSIVVALLTLGLEGALKGIYTLAFCPDHQTWLRAQGQNPWPVLRPEYGVARAGDAIFACEKPHLIGPIVLHTDMTCYCAPVALDPSTLSASVRASCVLDRAIPYDDRIGGECPARTCHAHLDLSDSPTSKSKLQ